MMEAIGRYLLQIVAAAILCSVLGSLCDKSPFAPAIRMILSVVMVISVLQPILTLRLDDLTFQIRKITSEGERIVLQGKESALATASAMISDSVGAYIVDKAAQWGADIAVRIDLKEGIPDSVTIEGNVPPYVRSQLSAWIASEVGIEREAQYWN